MLMRRGQTGRLAVVVGGHHPHGATLRSDAAHAATKVRRPSRWGGDGRRTANCSLPAVSVMMKWNSKGSAAAAAGFSAACESAAAAAPLSSPPAPLGPDGTANPAASPPRAAPPSAVLGTFTFTRR